MKKKVVFFIGGLNFGGMERVVFIASELLKKDYDITIVTLYQTNADYSVDFPIYDLDVPPEDGKIKTLKVFLKRWWKTIKMKKELKADIVWSFGMYSNYLNALSKKKEKIIMGIRSYDWLTKSFIIPAVDRYIVSKFDAINSVSKLIAKDAQDAWGIDATNNTVIYNPYDIRYIQEKALETIDDYCFEKDKFYFVSMGRLAHQKAYDRLIKAFAKVAEKVGNAHLIIMGNGEMRNELEELLVHLNLKNKVDLLEGKRNPYKYIRCAQVYVLSSYTEGFPNALVEAMCIGTPVIAVNCKSGPAEILYKEMHYDMDEMISYDIADYGILTQEMQDIDNQEIRERNEKALSDAMLYAFEHKDKMEQLAEKALERVEEFSYQSFKEGIVKEIERHI